MLPGRRTDHGAIFIAQGPPPAGTPLVGGIAVSPAGVIYASESLAPVWSPADLFLEGEQGAWYDPSDLSTMFQDSAGTTPVTGVGQPVGMILDKSKDLVLGPELAVNGDFSNGTTGWVGTSTTLTNVNNELVVTNVGDYGYCTPASPISTIAGKWYKVIFDIVSKTTTSVTFRAGTYGNAEDLATKYMMINSGQKEYLFKAGTTTSYMSFQLDAGVGVNFVLDNFSVKELPGNHASQATAASRPLYTETGVAKWTDYDAVDDVLNTTFPSALGSSCTVARANVGTAPTTLTAQTIGTSYADSTDNAGLIVVDRALTTQETSDLTAWLTAKGATA